MARVSKKLDAEITRAWGIHASGVQVDIMDIPRIFADCRKAVGEGKTVEEAVQDAVAKYRITA